jgi:hypothetical protein
VVREKIQKSKSYRLVDMKFESIIELIMKHVFAKSHQISLLSSKVMNFLVIENWKMEA